MSFNTGRNIFADEVLITSSPGASIAGTLSTFVGPFPGTVPPRLNGSGIKRSVFGSDLKVCSIIVLLIEETFEIPPLPSYISIKSSCAAFLYPPSFPSPCPFAAESIFSNGSPLKVFFNLCACVIETEEFPFDLETLAAFPVAVSVIRDGSTLVVGDVAPLPVVTLALPGFPVPVTLLLVRDGNALRLAAPLAPRVPSLVAAAPPPNSLTSPGNLAARPVAPTVVVDGSGKANAVMRAIIAAASSPCDTSAPGS